ncbi:MAG: NUDIX hydrolase [Rhodobacterales bacterium]|nr:MAG: NUDIX hydrolase [Rhodobacterales bacterium]
MGVAEINPIRLDGSSKRDLRTQFGALPFRVVKGQVEVLMVTTRTTGRWILPKGWPIDGQTPAEAAATEAFEEAGVEGKAFQQPIGFYAYSKAHEGDDLPIFVAIFPLRVKKIHADWPEKSQRKRKWMRPKKAAKLVSEPDLAPIIAVFDPTKLKR